HASKGEVGYSLSILEYMSAGLATIVPDNPSTCLATRDSETGLTYPHGNIKAACESIKQCFSSTLKEKLSNNAIQEVKTHYSITDTNEKLVLILKNIYSGAGQREKQ
ncbi:MAG: glycosyltransferase, partial [Gammaproteobacteria bacterium]|nr:glycosyltransferase [Gammaproteobacteria bacterium]